MLFIFMFENSTQGIREHYGISSKVRFSRFSTLTPHLSYSIGLAAPFWKPLSPAPLSCQVCLFTLPFPFLSSSSSPLLIFAVAIVGFHEIAQRQRKFKLLSKPTSLRDARHDQWPHASSITQDPITSVT